MTTIYWDFNTRQSMNSVHALMHLFLRWDPEKWILLLSSVDNKEAELETVSKLSKKIKQGDKIRDKSRIQTQVHLIRGSLVLTATVYYLYAAIVFGSLG